MNTVRDLGRIEPWQESLERSRARRGKLARSSTDDRPPLTSARPPLTSARPPLTSARPPLTSARPPVTGERQPATEPRRERSANDRPRGLHAVAKRPRMVVATFGLILAFAITAVTLPSMLAGGGATASGTGDGSPFHRLTRPTYAKFGYRAGRPRASVPNRPRTCRPADRASGYANPLAKAHVTPERIDQGVDYSGSGTLSAVGAGRISYVATYGTGWPGTFIEYRLSGGPDAGCYVYYAEGVAPAATLHVGQTVRAGEPIASIIPGWGTGIELGWGAGSNTTTYAEKMRDWTPRDDADNIPSRAGKSFAALIALLGGPPGKDEG